MSLLREVILDLRKPIVEGKGIKVFYVNENKYQVKCKVTGKRYTYTTDRDLDIGDHVTMDGKRREVVKVLSEAKGHYMVRKGPDGWYVRKHIGLGTEDVSGPHPNKETAEKHVPEDIKEGWGWEDVWQDMLDDQGVQSLVQEVANDWKIAQDQGLDGHTFLDFVSNRMDRYEDEARVELTDEEKTVFLKVVERVVLKGGDFQMPW